MLTMECLIFETQVMEGENKLLKVVLSFQHTCAGAYTCAPKNTCISYIADRISK